MALLSQATETMRPGETTREATVDSLMTPAITFRTEGTAGAAERIAPLADAGTQRLTAFGDNTVTSMPSMD